MSSTISMMGAVNVGFSGSFLKSGTTTQFTMTGNASLGAASVAGANGSFRISNVPGQAGVLVTVALNFVGITGNGSLAVNADGTFDGTFNARLAFPGFNVGGTVRIGNIGYNPNRVRVGTYVTVDGWITLAGASFRLNGGINSDGSFRFVASAGPWGWGTSFNAGVVEFGFGAYFASSVTVTSYSPYVAVNVSGSAWMDNRWWNCSWQGGRWNRRLECGWGGWGRSATIGIGFNSNPGNVYFSLGGYNYNLR